MQMVRGAGSGVGGGADEGLAEGAHAGGAGGRAGEVDGGGGDANLLYSAFDQHRMEEEKRATWSNKEPELAWLFFFIKTVDVLILNLTTHII